MLKISLEDLKEMVEDGFLVGDDTQTDKENDAYDYYYFRWQPAVNGVSVGTCVVPMPFFDKTEISVTRRDNKILINGNFHCEEKTDRYKALLEFGIIKELDGISQTIIFHCKINDHKTVAKLELGLLTVTVETIEEEKTEFKVQ